MLPIDSNATFVNTDSDATVVEGSLSAQRPAVTEHENLSPIERGKELLTDLHNEVKNLLASQVPNIKIFGGSGSNAMIRGALGRLLSPSNDGLVREGIKGVLGNVQTNELYSIVGSHQNQSAQVSVALENLKQFCSDQHNLLSLPEELQIDLRALLPSAEEVAKLQDSNQVIIKDVHTVWLVHKLIKGILGRVDQTLPNAPTPDSSTAVLPNTLG